MGLINICNELIVENIKSSISFYSENLNFKIEATDGNPINWTLLSNGSANIMLESYEAVCKEFSNFPLKTNSSNIIKFQYDNIEQTKVLYEKLKQNKVEFLFDIRETDYGTIEFAIYDLDRNIIMISVDK